MIKEQAFDLEGLAETPIREPSAAGYITLFGACARPADATRLVQQLSRNENWPAFPVPTTPTTAPSFDPNRYWRGNVWLNVNWLIYQGLRQYDYTSLAGELAWRSLQLVEQAGFWEYYHPLTGLGQGSYPHSWSTLVLDMLAQEHQSHLPAPQ